MISALDAAISWDILGSWIDLKSLVLLNTAHCHRKDRQTLACLLSSKEYVFRNPATFRKPETIGWLSTKKIKVSCIVLGPNRHLELLSSYLRVSGPAVTTVNISSSLSYNSNKSSEMYTIAIHCINLQILVCKGVQLESAFKDLLWCNPNLTEIWLDTINCQCTAVFENMPLHKLSNLSVSNSACDNNFVGSGLALKNALTKLKLGSSVLPQVILQFAHSSPTLKSLSLKDAQLPNETIIVVCSVLPNLLHLDVSNNRLLTSVGALAIFEKLKVLRPLNIRACSAIGDVSIRNLATQCGMTLEVVYMTVQNINEPSAVEALRMFSAQCPRLHFLSISCNRNVLCLAGGTFALLHELPMLRTLLVDAEEVISVSSREFLKVIKPRLQIEVMNAEKHTYDALTMPIG